jgi:hypothetical protein
MGPKDFEGVKTLNDAVEIVQKRLTLDGKPEYAALLTEARLRAAIRTGVAGYEKILVRKEKLKPGSNEYFEKNVKPVCEKIADTGEWPQGCSFFRFYTLKSEGIAYDGLGLRLSVETPQARSPSFALPVLDLYFGCWQEPVRTSEAGDPPGQ